MRVRWQQIIALGFGLAMSVSLSSAAQKVHVVSAGQTPGGIAHKYGISVADLRSMNQLALGVRLHVGQKLLIPEPGEVARIQQKKRAPKPAPGPVSALEAPLPSAAVPAIGSTTPADTAAADPPVADSHVEQTDVTTTEREPAPEVAPQPSPREPVVSRAPSTTISEHHSKSIVEKSNVERQTHVVAQGNTIGKIAHRYHLREQSILRANGLRRTDHLKLGQTLLIPSSDDDPVIATGATGEATSNSKKSGVEVDKNGMSELSVPGSGPVYYYEPAGPGRNAMRPVLVYLHGRGGDAEQDCHKWATVARHFGWLVCPSGPVAHNSGRSWNNSWPSGQHAVMGAIHALRDRYGRRIQLFGNTLIGFSEGAFVAMNVGVREPKTFNRWLILGADTSYWGGSGLEALQDARGRVRRVVLITGGRDQVVEDTRKVAEWLSRARVPIKVQTPEDLAHEVALDRMPGLYENALRWLDRGGQPRAAAQR
jgi:LysM repeat protein/predicted esterase